MHAVTAKSAAAAAAADGTNPSGNQQ